MDCFASLAMTVPYRFAFRFDFFAFFTVFRFFDAFFGTFLPLALASDSPIAIACLRLLTFRPERPLRKVPALRFFIARSTSADAFFEYLRAMAFLRCTKSIPFIRRGSGSACIDRRRQAFWPLGTPETPATRAALSPTRPGRIEWH
jgi:hypothetical protein